jgi:dihydroorotate dehydrogenase
MRLGFGFVEAGTVTPRPQEGNPQPRLFRLDRGRGGHQPHGHQQCRACTAFAAPEAPGAAAAGGARRQCRREQGRRGSGARLSRPLYPAWRPMPPTSRSTSPRPTPPACATCRARSGWPPSSPRSRPRDGRPKAARAGEAGARPRGGGPGAHRRGLRGAGVAGLIISNTTSRAAEASLRSPLKDQIGGLSGAPLFEPSTEMLSRACTGSPADAWC